MSRAALRRIAYAGIIVLWVSTTAVLIARQYRPEHGEILRPSALTLPEEFFGEQWMGVYFRGGKIGYSRSNFEKTNHGYRLSEKLSLHFMLMGIAKEIETDTEAFLSPDLAMEEFHAVLKADTDIDVRGKVRGREIVVTIQTSGGSTSRVIPLPKSTSLGLSMLSALFMDGIKKGKRFEVAIMDPVSLTPQQTEIELLGREKVEARGQHLDAYKLKGSVNGADFFLWLTDKGEVLREESPSGFTLVSERREEAQRRVGVPADVAVQASLPFNMRLPAETRYLKVRISGIDSGKFALDGGRQRFRDGILDIAREDLQTEPADYQDSGKDKAEVDRSLRESVMVQSRDRRIVELSADIVRGERDTIKAATLICDWAFRNIGKTPSVTLPSAIDILLSRRGDCNEHTTLYAALARAAGIPTRMVAGLVYRDGRLYYHSWPEIFAGRWIAVDPTFGQFPADASHIRLLTGDIGQQGNVITLIGRIQIEGIDYR